MGTRESLTMATSASVVSSDDEVESTVYMDDEEHRQTMQRLYHPKKQHMKTATTTTCTNIKNDSSELRKSDSTAGPPSFCADDIMPHIFDGTESRMSASFNFENIQYLDNINNKSANIENKSMETVSDKFCAGFIIESEENLDDAHTDNSKTSKKSRKRKKSKRSEVTSNQQKESILISRTNSDRSSASNLNHKHSAKSAIQSYISNASGSSASTISNVSSMSKYIQQQQQQDNDHDDDNVNDFIPMSSAKTKRRRMHRRGASEEVFSTKKDIPIIRRKIQLQNANGVNISFDDNDDDYDDYDNNENGSFYSNEVIPKPRASVCEKQTFIKFNANKAKQPKAKRIKKTKKKKSIEYDQESGARKTKKRIKDNKMRTTKKKKQQNVPNLIRASTLNPRMKKKHSFNNESSNDIYSNKRPSSHKKRGNMRTRYSFNTQESHTNSSNPTTQFSFDTDPDDNDDNDDYYDDDESEDNEQQTLDDIINKFWTAIDISANGCVQ